MTGGDLMDVLVAEAKVIKQRVPDGQFKRGCFAPKTKMLKVRCAVLPVLGGPSPRCTPASVDVPPVYRSVYKGHTWLLAPGVIDWSIHKFVVGYLSLRYFSLKHVYLTLHRGISLVFGSIDESDGLHPLR